MGRQIGRQAHSHAAKSNTTPHYIQGRSRLEYKKEDGVLSKFKAQKGALLLDKGG